MNPTSSVTYFVTYILLKGFVENEVRNILGEFISNVCVCFRCIDCSFLVVYTKIVYLSKFNVKLKFTCFSLWTAYRFVTESIHAFPFDKYAVVHKALLV